jgi:hypothetical protein
MRRVVSRVGGCSATVYVVVLWCIGRDKMIQLCIGFEFEQKKFSWHELATDSAES